MIQAVPLSCSNTTFLGQSNSYKSAKCVSICSSLSRNIPKLEPFSRTKFDRAFKEPPLIQKSENDIADYCLTLEGDDSYGCWRAYFELKDLEKEGPKEEVERLILESGGVKSLIQCVHGVAEIHKSKKDSTDSLKHSNLENTRANPCPIPDGLPKTLEEIQEEEKSKMPDSPFTRLLRARGKHPAWYSPVPEHETD